MRSTAGHAETENSGVLVHCEMVIQNMIIYKITNKLNGKVYIGQTTRSLAARIYGHIHNHSRVGKDMVKYGRDNFDISVIDNAETKEELDDLEIFWIAWYNSTQNGYNILRGGKATKDELRMINKLGLNKPRKHHNRRRGRPPKPIRRPPKPTIRKDGAREHGANEAKGPRSKGVIAVNKWAKIISEQEIAANKEFRRYLMSR